MNSYVEMYKNICRVCLTFKNSAYIVSLVDNSSLDGLSSFGKAVLCFTNITIQSDDNLPPSMCFDCLKLLKNAIHFKLKCEKSNKHLKNWIDNTNSGDVEEVIVQNIMFLQHFPEDTLANSEERHDTSKYSNNVKTSPEYAKSDFDDSSKSDCDVVSIVSHNSATNQDYNIESTDELLDIMEKLVSRSTKLNNTEYKNNLHKKYKQRLKRQNKKEKQNTTQKNSKLKKVKPNSVKRLNANKKYICKLCNKDLANPSTYRYHMERHTGCKYICEHCGKGFPVLAELHLHTVARHGTGPSIQCKFCKFKALRKHILIEHERLHTGERPYTCDKCGLTFRRRAIWRKHMIYHTEKTVQCPQCPRKFFRQSEMQCHANSMHERLYMYLCHKCDATYAKTASVRRHLTEQHGIPREMQGKISRVHKGRSAVFSEQ